MDKLIRLLQQAEENNQKLFIQWMQTDPTAKAPDANPIIGLTIREEIFAQMVTAHTHLVNHAIKLLQNTTEKASTQCVKPSMGIKPRWVLDEDRNAEILEYFIRLTQAGAPLPAELCTELAEITIRQKLRNIKP